MCWKKLLFKAILFALFVPGIVFRVLPHASMQKQAIVHAILFIIVSHVLYKMLFKEGFENPDTRINPPCPSGYKQCSSGDCVLETDIHTQCPS